MRQNASTIRYVSETIVVALGGNALIREDQRGTYDEQVANARSMARSVAELLQAGWRVVVVHGNGPQVGNVARAYQAACGTPPAEPLTSLVAMTQGQIGSLLALALHEECGRRVKVVSVVTHSVVDPDRDESLRPAKPIGAFFTADEAASLQREHDWVMRDDAGRGFRRYVPSPDPVAIVEAGAIHDLVNGGYLVIACGGGGVAVARAPRGYRRVEGVIDKDSAAQLLATELGAEVLGLVTGVRAVHLDFGKPSERPVHFLTSDAAASYLSEGQFPIGSMGPKVRAALRFLDHGGRVAAITTPELLHATLAQDPGAEAVGTRIVPASDHAKLS